MGAHMLISRSEAKFSRGDPGAGNFQGSFGQFAKFGASRDASLAALGVLRIAFFHTPSLARISYVAPEYRN